MSIDSRSRVELTASVLASALAVVRDSGPVPEAMVGGIPAQEGPLRDGLERAYRELAGLTESQAERIELVDQANNIRRWTLS